MLGKIKEGEGVDEGFEREVWEETEIEVSKEVFIECPKPFFTQWKRKIYENRYYFLFVNKGTEIDLKGENDEYVWIKREKLEEDLAIMPIVSNMVLEYDKWYNTHVLYQYGDVRHSTKGCV